MVEVGKQVENFERPANGGKTIQLNDFRGKYVVLYFYPKDNTKGCTTEGEAFRDHHQDFTDLNAVILGASRDSVKSHENFIAKYSFPFDLLSDQDESLCNQFDVIKEKNMYGRKVLGIERGTFLIDPTGVLIHEWRKVRVKDHVPAVLSRLKEAVENAG